MAGTADGGSCLLQAGALTGSPLTSAVGPPAHPLLSVTVLQVVDGAVIPVQPNAHQVAGQEAIFCQDHKVGKEATKSLDHSWRWGGDEERFRSGPAQGTSKGDSTVGRGGSYPRTQAQLPGGHPGSATWWRDSPGGSLPPEPGPLISIRESLRTPGVSV